MRSRLEERTSFLSVFMEVFVKNGYFRDSILHSSAMLGPIFNLKTAFESACSITARRTEFDRWTERIRRVKVDREEFSCNGAYRVRMSSFQRRLMEILPILSIVIQSSIRVDER